MQYSINKFLNNTNKMYLAILFLVFISVAVRFYDLNAPPFDTHSYRQTETLSTVEDFYENGIDLLQYKTHYVGYPGYQILEFPFFQAIAASVWRVFPAEISTIRILNIAINLFTALLIILLIKKFFSSEIAFLTGAVYLITPLNMIYSRGLLLEPTAVFLNILIIYLYFAIGNLSGLKSMLLFLIWAVSVALAAVIKPLYLFPFCIIFLFTVFKRKKITILMFGSALLISFILLLFWLEHAKTINATSYFTQGINVEHHLGFNELFTLKYWLVLMQRFILKITPGPGIFFFLFSIVLIFLKKSESPKSNLSKGAIIAWVIIAGYLSIFANINSPHDYYQLILLPFVSFLTAYSLYYFIEQEKLSRIKNIFMFVFLSTFLMGSLLTFFTYIRPSVQLIEFQERVKPHLNADNKFVFLFVNASKYESFKNYPKSKYEKGPDFGGPTAIYSISKWGICKRDCRIIDSIEYLKKVPGDLLKNFGEIIYYRYFPEDFSKDNLYFLKINNYKKKYEDNFVVIFERLQ